MLIELNGFTITKLRDGRYYVSKPSEQIECIMDELTDALELADDSMMIEVCAVCEAEGSVRSIQAGDETLEVCRDCGATEEGTKYILNK